MARFVAADKAPSRLGGLCLLLCMIKLKIQYKAIAYLTSYKNIIHVKSRAGVSTAKDLLLWFTWLAKNLA